MAKERKTITEAVTTGKGELTGFISILEPSTTYNKDGVYSASILLPKEEGEKLLEKIKKIRTEQYKTFGKGTKVTDITNCVPYGIVDEATGEEEPDAEGRYIIKAKANAYIKKGVPQFYVGVFDSKLKPIKEARIGAGTIARLSLSLEGYSVAGKTGVSIKLKAVQIIDLVEYTTTDASSFGFKEEDGYIFTESEENMTDEVVEWDTDDEEIPF